MIADHRRNKLVADGLGLGSLGWLVAILSVAPLLAMPFLPIAGSLHSLEKTLNAGINVYKALAATSGLLMLIGQSLCLYIPRESRAGTYALVALFCTFFPITFSAIGLVVKFPGATMLCEGSFLLAYFAQAVFLTKVSDFMDRRDLSDLSRKSIRFAIYSIVLSLLLYGFILVEAVARRILNPADENLMAVLSILALISIPFTIVGLALAIIFGALAMMRYMRATIGLRKELLKNKLK